MHTILWNGFSGKLEVFRGDEDSLNTLAKFHLDENNDVIYFYACIKSIELEEE